MTPYAKYDSLIRAALLVPGWYEKRVEPRIHRELNGGCWIWTAGRNHGYAQVTLPSSVAHLPVRASRVVWLAGGRNLLPDLVLDHDGENGCSNRACVRPDCLEMVTPARNSRTGRGFCGVNSRKATCPKGHPLEGDNLRPSSSAEGRRGCLTCNREYATWRNRMIRDAAQCLGVRPSIYVREFGWSAKSAQAILAARLAVAA